MGITDVIERLPDAEGYRDPDPFAGPDHPMRKITRSIAFDTGDDDAETPWSPDRAVRVADLFDGLAAEWSERQVNADKAAPVNDALSRGNVDLDVDWLELGTGTGAGMRLLHGRVASLVATDLSSEMLLHAPDGLAPKVRADASMLPFVDDQFDAILLINMLLFPLEVDRVLRPNGVIVWVNTKGDQTPIHLPPRDVAAALPGEWNGVESRAGSGLWCVLRRSLPH